VAGDDVNGPRIALVVNPASGVGRAAKLSASVAARLSADATVSVQTGTSAAHAVELIAAAAAQHDAVVVLGGDGMVHLALQALAEGDTPLGIVPGGTGNDIADVLGFHADPLVAADQVLAAVLASSVRRADLGRTEEGRWWATVLCAGFDSAVNERANRMRWPKGPRRYDVAIVAEMMRLRPRRFRIELDDEAMEVSATLVAIGNGPQYGGHKRMTPDGRMDSGVFAVTVVGPVSRLTLARLAPKLPNAGHIGHPAVTTYTARSVRLTALGVDAEPGRTVAFADGERMGPLPVNTTCVPAALPVLVPPGVVGRAFSPRDD
jgi:diacylglycerol kinase (ATP)